jgi:flagellar biosynthesis GTPase FlhF
MVGQSLGLCYIFVPAPLVGRKKNCIKGFVGGVLIPPLGVLSLPGFRHQLLPAFTRPARKNATNQNLLRQNFIAYIFRSQSARVQESKSKKARERTRTRKQEKEQEQESKSKNKKARERESKNKREKKQEQEREKARTRERKSKNKREKKNGKTPSLLRRIILRLGRITP